MSTLAAVRRWPTQRSKQWTEDLLLQAKSDSTIQAIVAIGSAVRPNVRSVDLDLIMIRGGATASQFKPPLEIDLRVYDAHSINKQIEEGSDLLSWAIKFGRVLFQRNNYWDALVRSWENRLPLPPLDVARKRSVEAFGRLVDMMEVGDLDAARELALSYLTHLGRAELLSRGVYPASRPELPGQLRGIGAHQLAEQLQQLISRSNSQEKLLRALIERGLPSSDQATAPTPQ